uniref:Uncharacterized protein n=1 Tax=Physcomitrium patens TaxID=3218 RepID=A0A2K1IYP4_PHYPA|nr:hypothetical protein PHYPA_024215 [Physcomitrium patens]
MHLPKPTGARRACNKNQRGAFALINYLPKSPYAGFVSRGEAPGPMSWACTRMSTSTPPPPSRSSPLALPATMPASPPGCLRVCQSRRGQWPQTDRQPDNRRSSPHHPRTRISFIPLPNYGASALALPCPALRFPSLRPTPGSCPHMRSPLRKSETPNRKIMRTLSMALDASRGRAFAALSPHCGWRSHPRNGSHTTSSLRQPRRSWAALPSVRPCVRVRLFAAGSAEVWTLHHTAAPVPLNLGAPGPDSSILLGPGCGVFRPLFFGVSPYRAPRTLSEYSFRHFDDYVLILMLMRCA